MNNETISEQQARLFRTLGHPARLAILEVLRGGEECVCHIEAVLGFRQAYVSQQLALLRDAGIVSDRRDGLNSFYRIVRPEIFTLMDIARLILNASSAQVHRRPAGCDCPKCSPARVELTQ